MSYRVPPEPGGKERHTEFLTREQLKRGHEITLAFRRGHVVPDGATVLRTRPTLLSRALGAKSDVLAFAAEVGAALRRSERPDLVHLHGDHVEAAVLGPVCRRLGIPLVMTLHATLSERHRAFARMALRGVDACFALGTAAARDLVERGVDPRHIETASSGLDLDSINRTPHPAARQPGLVVSVGSLDPMKNHALLISAFHELRRTRPDIQLVIAGDGPERDALLRLAAGAGERAKAGEGNGVVLAGRLAQDDIYRLVRRAEVFVLASRRLDGKGEGVPTAALEALALGTPVIVSSDAALIPVVRDPQAYRMFTSGSRDELVSVLDSVLGDEEARSRMSACGERAARELGWPAVADKVERMYSWALGAPPTPPIRDGATRM
ncbi:glycosyltransferase family 4 protein [Nonomuraea sp. NPDC049141]|uniref:glycosyltransferase family 4 protein n=1 Tax=Nonomuraea sp. NPDC049141 TaxID=3155500 RepID=UPI0033CBD952